jgi:F-type H+-transporting ATPase subunit b
VTDWTSLSAAVADKATRVEGLAKTVMAETAEGGEAYGPAIPTEVWLLGALAIVIAIAWKPAKRGILGALDGRAQRIASELEEAKKLREEAQSRLAELQRKQRDAMNEAEEIIAHARSEAERHREEAAKALEDQLARREQQAMDRIAQAESQAAADVQRLAADLATAAARQIIAEQVDDKKAAEMIDQTIQDLPNRLH